jgi:4'-phosphopantetheinyl transferase
VNGGDVLVVWESTAALTGQDVSEAVALLSDEERARYERTRFADVARDYAATHALVRRVLAHGRPIAPRDWRFERHPSGKPYVDGESVCFSLSHTLGLVACAVADDEVGVDVEATGRDADVGRIAARFFSAREVDELDRLDPAARRERFFDLWTLKEALVKACGRELSSSVRELEFHIDDADAHRRVRLAAATDVDAARWQFALFSPAAGYRAAVAARHEIGRPRRITILNGRDLLT